VISPTASGDRHTRNRIVNEFEARGWVERTPDGTYAGTPTGEHLVRQFRPFLESVEAIRTLGEAVAWLPTDELSIGLHHFSDATVWEPAVDPTETIDQFARMIETAHEYHNLTHFAPPAPVAKAILYRQQSDGLTMRAVATSKSIFVPEAASGSDEGGDR